MVLAALLAATLAQADERDLSFTVELTGGRMLGASGFIDYGVLPDVVYLNAGYSLLKPPALPPTATTPGVPTVPSHVFSGGVDWTPGRHLNFSLMLSGSPRATDAVVLNPAAPLPLRATLYTWHSNVGGSLMAAWLSGGLSNFEWVLDGGLMVTANTIGRGFKGPTATAMTEDGLWSFRGLAGLTLILFDRTEVSLRAGYTGYSADPLTVGRFSDADATATLLSTNLELLGLGAQQAAARLGQADSLSGYAAGPVWWEAKVSVRQRFSRTWSGQLGWTYNRYVPTAGYSNTLSTKVTVRLGERWRVWGGVAVQVDVVNFERAVSGQGTVAVELTL